MDLYILRHGIAQERRPGLDDARRALNQSVPDLDRYAANGQIEIFPHTAWYLKDGYFDRDRVLKGWVEKYEQGLARGCAGLRFTGNSAWLDKNKTIL